VVDFVTVKPSEITMQYIFLLSPVLAPFKLSKARPAARRRSSLSEKRFIRKCPRLYTRSHANPFALPGDPAVISWVWPEIDCGFVFSVYRAGNRADRLAQSAKKKARAEARA
jgi:hypothetical protein